MPSNPMQRKVRNSFLIGMIVMLFIALLIGALLFMLMVKPMLDEQKAEESVQYTSVYKLKTDVRSKTEIDQSMLELVNLPSTDVPTDKIIASNDGGTTQIPFYGGKAKINLTAGTILCDSLLIDDEEKDTSERLVEYNMLTLQTTLDVGDFIDVRIAFANGQDLIVIAGKEVVEVIDDTITLRLSEGEILMMNSAIVEAYILPTSNLYVSKYPLDIQPGLDEEVSTVTYAPTEAVQALMKSNANITSEALQNFENRFISNLRESYINSQIEQYSNDRDVNIETGIREQIEKAQTARENYLSGI